MPNYLKSYSGIRSSSMLHLPTKQRELARLKAKNSDMLEILDLRSSKVNRRMGRHGAPRPKSSMLYKARPMSSILNKIYPVSHSSDSNKAQRGPSHYISSKNSSESLLKDIFPQRMVHKQIIKSLKSVHSRK